MSSILVRYPCVGIFLVAINYLIVKCDPQNMKLRVVAVE